MRSQKATFPLLLVLLLFAAESLQAQCECPDLPDDITGRTVTTVSTVMGLDKALSNCSTNNGNYTILLENGVYELENNLLYIGPHVNNLSIRSVSGHRDSVVLMGQGMTGNVSHIFSISADNFTLADLTIGWVANHPLQIHCEHDADNTILQNVRFVDSREQLLKGSGSMASTSCDNGIVQCCLFEFTAGVAHQWYTGGVDIHNGDNWVVFNNTFKHIRSPDASLAEHAIHFWSGSGNTIIENNLIIDCDRGIGFGLGNSEHDGGIIRNNFVHTSRDVGIGLESASNAKVYNNTVITENYPNSIEYRFEATTNAHIANNLCTDLIKSRNGGTGLVEYNFQTDDMDIFVDADNYDYHLLSNDIDLVNAGIFLDDINLDYDCHPRSSPDIGADEFDSTINGIIDNSNTVFLEIYPNPTRGSFFVKTEKPGILQLYGINGQQFFRQQIERGKTEITELELQSGIYLVKITYDRRQVVTRKLVVQNGL